MVGHTSKLSLLIQNTTCVAFGRDRSGVADKSTLSSSHHTDVTFVFLFFGFFFSSVTAITQTSGSLPNLFSKINHRQAKCVLRIETVETFMVRYSGS